MTNKIEVVHIVACDLNGCIGNNGELPWHLPADLKRFKELTSGGVVVMGRKTFESLNCKPLPNRVNIVITKDPNFQIVHKGKGVIFYNEISFAIQKAKYEASILGLKEVWIIGGQTIYEQTMPYVDSIELTCVIGKYSGDTYYPTLPAITVTNKTGILTDPTTKIKYEHLTFKVTKEMTDKQEVHAGRKHDSNKPRYSLLPSGTVNQVIQVLEYGASDKYEVDNWQKIPDARRRFYDAAMRHIDAWWNGEINDLDKDGVKGSQLPHLAHAICCLLFLLWFDDQE